jgi:hypothetical protein
MTETNRSKVDSELASQDALHSREAGAQMRQALSTELRKNVPATPASRTPAPLSASPVAEEWPQLWFSASERHWSSLVIVPAAPDSAAALFVANALVESARLYSEGEVTLVNGIGSGHAAANEIVSSLRAQALRGNQSIVAVDCPLTSHAAIHIARAADAAILLVPLGATKLDGARKVMEAIGADRLIGSVTLKGGK